MFLALTADERYWDKGRPLLFLGEWCRLFHRRKTWSVLAHEVLPYPWDDQERLYEDFLHLEEKYEHFLKLLSTRLNTLGQTSFSSRYWRIVIGPWLFFFIQSFYERYICLKAASKRGGIQMAWIPSTKYFQPPTTFNDFVQELGEDRYNLHLYGDIIRSTRIVRAEEKDFSTEAIVHRPSRFLGMLRSWLWRLGRFNRTAIVESSFPFWASLKIHLRRREIPLWGNVPEPCFHQKTEWELRKPLVNERPGDSFEDLLCNVIPRHLPKSYLEGRAAVRKYGQAILPRFPKIALTANASIGSDVFKVWAAEQAERGVPFVLVQHGGQYGCGKWNSQEAHERTIADRYYTWGWSSTDSPHVVPFSAPRLIRCWPNRKVGGNILMALMSVPRYSYWMYSIPFGPQQIAYLDDQRKFLRGLSSATRNRVTVRLYPKDWGWSQKDRLAEEFPDVHISLGRVSMLKELKESSLFIGTYNATAFLETFAANFPTVLFWDPTYWKLRESARPYFDELKKVGILYDSPELAAGFVSRISKNPDVWWRTVPVQAAVHTFCERFARHTDCAVQDWVRELDKLAAESPK